MTRRWTGLLTLASPLLLLSFFPFALSAQVVLSEIMYDLEGSDSKREWIEVVNTGSSAVDLSNWRFFEAESNHKLSLSKGNALLSPGGHAVIASDATTFLSDYSGFSGTVFDSSFSLSNTGEKLTIRDGDLNDIDSVTYSSDWGAAGDGTSLTLSHGSWVASSPTPGSGSVASGSTGATEQTHALQEEGEITNFSPKPQEFIVVDIGKDRNMAVGAAEFFEATGYKKDGTVHPYISYRWNFGNGVVKEGQKVLHQYNYPGKYVVWVAGIAADKLSATDRMIVTVEPVDLFVSAVAPAYVELTNNSSRELNLSLWSLRGGNGHYMLPENTIILPRASVTFPSLVTGLDTRDPQNVALVYPNGMIASTYGRTTAQTYAEQSQRPQPVSVSANTGATQKAQESETFSRVSSSEREAFSATAHNALGEEKTSEYVYLLALLGVITVAIAGVIFSSRQGSVFSKDGGVHTLQADDFVIIEEKDKDENDQKNL